MRAQVCLKGTLFTPLSAHNTSTQSLNVQLRKELDLHVNLVHGFNIPGVPSRFSDVDVVVIRCGPCRKRPGSPCQTSRKWVRNSIQGQGLPTCAGTEGL